MTDIMKIWPVAAAWAVGCLYGYAAPDLWSWQYAAILVIMGTAGWYQSKYVRR
jgi:hypothetical protein